MSIRMRMRMRMFMRMSMRMRMSMSMNMSMSMSMPMSMTMSMTIRTPMAMIVNLVGWLLWHLKALIMDVSLAVFVLKLLRRTCRGQCPRSR